MLGAIIGDMCGSVYEWHNEKDINKIELLRGDCHPTDDTMMTIAIAKAFMDANGKKDHMIRDMLINAMHYYGRLIPDAGYGGRFKGWLSRYEREPYNSWGNGSAMRVSSVGWLFDTMEETLHAAKLSAEVTHNHPEGIKGAEAIAAAVFLARTGKSKAEIREYIEQNYYRLNFTLDEIRNEYTFDVSCQGSCPQAIEAFLEGTSFEDVLLKAISIGGDSDTIAAMAGGIAEAYYGIPNEVKERAIPLMTNRYRGNHYYPYSVIADEMVRFQEHAKKKTWNEETMQE